MEPVPEVLSDVADLLAHLGAGSLEDAGEILSEEAEPDAYFVEEDDDVVLRMSTQGTTLTFPMTVADFWEAVHDLEDDVVAGWSDD